MTTDTLFALALGYLLGSIPFGLVLTKAFGKGDIRDVGSGNIGATNVLRTGSKPLAAATLILDALKGSAAVLIAQAWLPEAVNFAAAGALVGHLYPLWLKFRGGKGVATLFGILVPLLPIAALAYVLVWAWLLVMIRISSVAGIAAAASAPLTAVLIVRADLMPMLLGFALLVIWKHLPNIARLKAGTEPQIGREG